MHRRPSNRSCPAASEPVKPVDPVKAPSRTFSVGSKNQPPFVTAPKNTSVKSSFHLARRRKKKKKTKAQAPSATNRATHRLKGQLVLIGRSLGPFYYVYYYYYYVDDLLLYYVVVKTTTARHAERETGRPVCVCVLTIQQHERPVEEEEEPPLFFLLFFFKVIFIFFSPLLLFYFSLMFFFISLFLASFLIQPIYILLYCI